MVLGQKAEEARQLKQDLQRVQSLFTSAERELRYEREKNVDLKRHNVLLDQEKLKVWKMNVGAVAVCWVVLGDVAQSYFHCLVKVLSHFVA